MPPRVPPSSQMPMNVLSNVAMGLFFWLLSSILEFDFSRPWCDVFKVGALFGVIASIWRRFFPAFFPAGPGSLLTMADILLVSFMAIFVYRHVDRPAVASDYTAWAMFDHLEYRIAEWTLVAVLILDLARHWRDGVWLAGFMGLVELCAMPLLFGLVVRTSRLISAEDSRRHQEKITRFRNRIDRAIAALMGDDEKKPEDETEG